MKKTVTVETPFDVNALVEARKLDLINLLADEHKRLVENHEKRLDELPIKAAQVVKLLEIGVIDEKNATRIIKGTFYGSVFAEPKQFPALYSAFGECKIDEDSKIVHDAEAATVRFRLKLGEDYIGPTIYVIRQLTGVEKCKIVTVTNTYTSTQLVCEKPDDADDDILDDDV